MNGLMIGALVALSMAQQTDTVFPARGARVLEVDVPAGSIVVTGWDRDDIAIKAAHSTRTYVEVRRSGDGTRVEVEAEARRGPATIVDFEISVPRRMSLELDAMSADITVTGVQGSVEADVTQGDVTVRDAGGRLELGSTTGKILVERATGGVEAETSAAEIRLVGVAGDITAESAGGDIIMEGITSSSVDVGTVGGRVHYDGTFRAGGAYFMGSHGGSITLVVPADAAATFHLASVHGSVSNLLSPQGERLEPGKRHTVEVGGGGALVEAETFGGRIRLVRKGAAGAQTPAPR